MVCPYQENPTQQYKCIDYWYTKQPEWIARELCCIKKASHKRLYGIWVLIWQKYRNGEKISVSEAKEWVEVGGNAVTIKDRHLYLCYGNFV